MFDLNGQGRSGMGMEKREKPNIHFPCWATAVKCVGLDAEGRAALSTMFRREAGERRKPRVRDATPTALALHWQADLEGKAAKTTCEGGATVRNNK